jgi:hypothetical protein
MKRLCLPALLIAIICAQGFSQKALGSVWVKEHVIRDQDVIRRDYVTGGSSRYRFTVKIATPYIGGKEWVDVRWDIWDEWSHSNYLIHVVSLRSDVLSLFVYQDVESLDGKKLLIFYTAPEPHDLTKADTGALRAQRGEASSDRTPQEAIAAQSPTNWAAEDQVTAPPTVDGTEAFNALRPDAPTDQFGSGVIKYGDDEPVDGSQSIEDVRTPDGSKPFLDLGGLDSLPTSGKPDSNRGVDRDENGGSTDSIYAESLTQLRAQRQLLSADDPDMAGLTLPNGLPTMVVWVEFTILRTGLVSRVTVEDTGNPILNSTIETSLRKWKFAPIVANRIAVARLKYVITSTD